MTRFMIPFTVALMAAPALGVTLVTTAPTAAEAKTEGNAKVKMKSQTKIKAKGHGNASVALKSKTKLEHKGASGSIKSSVKSSYKSTTDYASQDHIDVVRTCPPGLAKKSPACVPPGLAKTAHPEVGDVLEEDGFLSRYILVRDPGYYGLDPYGTYYRIDGQVFQVDRTTQTVLALIGSASRVLN